MKAILVPTDFSKSAKKALVYAIPLAQKEKATIILLHAFNLVYISPDTPVQYFDEELMSVRKASQKKLDALCTFVSKKKVKCETINMQGMVIDTIQETIKKKKIDLVIMGTKGASGISEILIGSNAAKVISKASCPVIAVPEKVSFKGVKKIVFATDYHAKDLLALKQLVELTRSFKPVLNIVHIADGEFTDETEEDYLKRFEKKVKEKISYKKISFQLLFNNKVEKAIEGYINKQSADLLAVSTGGKILIDRILGENTTKKLVYHTKVPMIIYHTK